jgi:probable rRNA maturation factor
VPVRLTPFDGPHPDLDDRELGRRARVIFRALQLGKSELSIVVTGDAQIRELNRAYRKKDRPTDVLAFAMREGEPCGEAGELLGDVIVSLETARKQAHKAGHDVLSEVTMLMTHGVLHLLGWDHETPSKDRRMRGETARLMELATQTRTPARSFGRAKKAGSAPSRTPRRAPRR